MVTTSGYIQYGNESRGESSLHLFELSAQPHKLIKQHVSGSMLGKPVFFTIS